jgi:formylglycine-generating enzyme required for sulfatase activity/tRNA A-37 threonylcarbamoyl transferase component Bud32
MIGQTINNRYLITTRIGKGAMGTVYRATDTQTGREVALKIIYSELAVDPAMLERFKREADALRQLKHPNIVEFVDAFEHDEQYVIVMEYLPGGSLFDLLLQGPLPIERVRHIAIDLCDALIRAHRLKLIHRDIKPENILMNEEGTPKLADFGLARLSHDTRVTRSGTQFGTPHYMAPEAWEGKTLDAQADIWSLGILMFEMLTGQVPFSGDTPLAVMNKVFTSQPSRMKRLRSNLPPSLVKIIRRMLARDKKQRYQTMREVAVDLERNQAAPLPVSTKTKRVAAGFFLIVGLVAGGLIFADNWLSPQVASAPLETQASIQDATQEPILPATAELSPVTETPSLGMGASKVGEDGATLMFVPEGEFIMGSDTNEEAIPIHRVQMDAFWIDQTEVTNAMYEKCVDAGVCEHPRNTHSSLHPVYYGNSEFDDYPVIRVDWHTANAYCAWVGRQLPTEAQWEKAARGTVARIYPWGNDLPTGSLLNYNNDVGDTTKVGSYPDGASVYGVLDMAGNVWEWTGTLYKPYPYEADDGREDLRSPEARVLRGGAWNSNGNFIRSAARIRSNPTNSTDYYGFRCALPFP